MHRRSFLGVLLSAATIIKSRRSEALDAVQFYPDIYILAGQSNMSGRGLISEVPIFDNYAKILSYSNAGKWVYGTEPIDDATGQVDSVSADAPAAAGPSMTFADALYDLRPGRYVGLVPCAEGGSSIASWARDLSRSTLYGSMIARAQEAAASGALKGFIWYQGESDADTTAHANAWAAAFTQIVTDMRSDLGFNIPGVMTVIGPDPSDAVNFPAWSTLVANQQGMTLPDGVARVSANDLTAQPADLIHLTTASQVTLGGRMATAMAGLL